MARMLKVHLSEAGIADVRERLRSLIVRPSLYDDYGLPPTVIEDLLDAVPDQEGIWEVPDWAEPLVRRALWTQPDVRQAVRVAALRNGARMQVAMRRLQVARQLFDEWHGVTNPELAGTLWHNLNAEDRQVWVDRARAKEEL